MPGPGGGRRYRTGDLGFCGPDGTLHITGRIDDMVKVRGFRVEPAEVQAQLEQLPEVRQAAVLACPDPSGGMELRAFVTARPGADRDGLPAGLRAKLGASLPEFMIPASISVLDELPTTSTGKVDRQTLAAMPRSTVTSPSYRAPRTAIEQEVAATWARLLRIETPGLDDNFLLLGGHSLLAMKVLFELRSSLMVGLSLEQLLNAANLEQFAAQVTDAVNELISDPSIAEAIMAAHAEQDGGTE